MSERGRENWTPPDVIYLQPCEAPDVTWCEDDVGPCETCGRENVRYRREGAVPEGQWVERDAVTNGTSIIYNPTGEDLYSEAQRGRTYYHIGIMIPAYAEAGDSEPGDGDG